MAEVVIEAPSDSTPVAPVVENPEKKSNRTRNLLIFTLLLLAIGGTLAFLYFTKWQ